jgi:coenzyme F420-reducing hydrogenase delta subunit
MDDIGLESKRLRMINISAAMGVKFASSATEFTEEIKQMGPNPIKQDATESESQKPDES